MTNLYKYLGSLLVASLIAFGVAYFVTIRFGGTTNLDTLELSENLTVTATTTATGELRIGNRFYYPIGGTCADLSATLLNIVNPLGATTTMTNFKVEGRNGGSTTVLQAGTTSIATLLGDSLPATPFINAVGIGTSSYFWIEAGIIQPTGGLATSSGAGTVERVTLAPDDRIYIRATSTVQNQAKSGDFTLNSLTDATNTFNCTWEALLVR